MKVAIVVAMLAVLSAVPARAADERASSATQVAAVLPDAPVPAIASANALPSASSAMITLKRPPAEHTFLDRTNMLALGVVAAGLTADALSTQKGLSYPGFYEVNPLARPFVNSRSGAAIYSAGSFGLLATGMYVAHRTRHHKLERILPFAIGGWEGLLSLRNYHVISQHTR